MERRRNSLHLRAKPNIVKEKPFLRLDMRRREAGGMARMCLRLHRPFRRAAEDPVLLDDAAAVVQLHEFVENPTCPVWLKKRYAKHNRALKKKNTVVESVAPTPNAGMALRPADAPARDAGMALRPAEAAGMALRPAEAAASQISGVALRPAGDGSDRQVINLSGPRDFFPEQLSDDEAPAPAAQTNSEHLLPDTLPNRRQTIANQHGLLWGSEMGDTSGGRKFTLVEGLSHDLVYSGSI